VTDEGEIAMSTDSQKKGINMPKTRLLLAAVIAAGHCQPVLAENKKPAIEIKSEPIELSVTIDTDLKAYPTLYAKLLADARKETERLRVDADKEIRENPEGFRSWTFERDYSVRSIIGNYVSVLRTDAWDGGIHPNRWLDTLLWDLRANKFINISPFFSETKADGPTLRALARAIRIADAADKKKRDIEIKDLDTDSWLSSVKSRLTDLGGIALAPSTEKGKSSGFSVYFSPYAVGSYGEGSYIVFVPWTAFKAYLSPAGTVLFGGTRPPDDEEGR
jgi:hypothetical protein